MRRTTRVATGLHFLRCYRLAKSSVGSAGFASSHYVRLSSLRSSVEPRSEELSAIRLRHLDFLLDTRIFSREQGRFRLYISKSYRGIRCLNCITVHNDAQLIYANLTHPIDAYGGRYSASKTALQVAPSSRTANEFMGGTDDGQPKDLPAIGPTGGGSSWLQRYTGDLPHDAIRKEMQQRT